MNFVLGGATSHWVTGSTWWCQLLVSNTGGLETHDYLRHLQRDGHLGDGPHAHGRVQEKTLAVDGSEHTDDSDAVADRAVVLDLAPRGNVAAREWVLLDDAGQSWLGLPLEVVCET